MQGTELRALRKQAGLTQAGFGAALHLSGAFVGEMERGEKVIEPRTAKLARELFGGRIDVAHFGEQFVLVQVHTVGGRRVHAVLTPAYDTEAEARAARTALTSRYEAVSSIT